MRTRDGKVKDVLTLSWACGVRNMWVAYLRLPCAIETCHSLICKKHSSKHSFTSVMTTLGAVLLFVRALENRNLLCDATTDEICVVLLDGFNDVLTDFPDLRPLTDFASTYSDEQTLLVAVTTYLNLGSLGHVDTRLLMEYLADICCINVKYSHDGLTGEQAVQFALTDITNTRNRVRYSVTEGFRPNEAALSIELDSSKGHPYRRENDCGPN